MSKYRAGDVIDRAFAMRDKVYNIRKLRRRLRRMNQDQLRRIFVEVEQALFALENVERILEGSSY